MEPMPSREYPCEVEGVRIVRLDWSDESPEGDRLWRTWAEFESALMLRTFGPDGNGGEDPDVARERRRTATRNRLVELLALEGDRPVAEGGLIMPLQDATHEAFIDPMLVAPEERGRGIGRALLAAMVQEARDHGRTEISLEVYDTGIGDHPLMDPVRDNAIAARAGFRAFQDMVCSTLEVPYPPAFHEAAARVAERGTPGYAIETSIGMPPQEWWADLAVLKERMAVDAPPGDRPATPEVWDADRVEAYFRRCVDLGQAVALAVARHEESGRLVGYTDSLWDPPTPHVIHQGDTLVRAEHRRHGLGLALKVAALTAILPHSPGARLHRTSNAAENTWMRRVNTELGYVRAFGITSWTKDI